MLFREMIREELRLALARAVMPHPAAAPSDELRLYSVNDAAKLIGVGRDFLYAAIERGELSYVDLSTHARQKRRIKAGELRRWIESRPTYRADGSSFA